MDYKVISEIEGFSNLERYGLNILKETLTNFLSCDILILYNPLEELLRHEINILDNIKRGFYPISEDKVIILGRILADDRSLISSIGISISKPGIKRSARFLTILEGALTNTLTKEYKENFHNCKFNLGEELVLHFVTNYLSIGGYDYRHIRHLVEYFNRMRTTSFEGKFFSTGLVLTKSHFDYSNTENRFGKTYPLKKSIPLSNTTQIDRRVWYLVDGKNTFFIGNKSLVLSQLFIINKDYDGVNYIDIHTLSKSIKGADLLFKLENEKLFSIINSDNIEISYSENHWRIRDFNFIRGIFNEHFIDKDLIESILFYIIYCSKNSISSILWLPKEISKIEEFTKSKNRLIKSPISINDKTFINHIIRYLSSDGATIIDREGFLQYFGCVIDLSKVNIIGLKGTGESAASALSSNGISIKISQDGTIKIFNDPDSKPIII